MSGNSGQRSLRAATIFAYLTYCSHSPSLSEERGPGGEFALTREPELPQNLRILTRIFVPTIFHADLLLPLLKIGMP